MLKIIMLLLLNLAVTPAFAESSSFSLEGVGRLTLRVTTLADATTPSQRMTLTVKCEGSNEVEKIFTDDPICFLNGHDWKKGILTLHLSVADVSHANITCDDYAQEINLHQLCPKH